jgi:murein hydrolase activator
MRRIAFRLAVALGTALPLPAASADGDAAALRATEAAADLRRAIDGLEAAEGARDRVAALTRTIKAYEVGLAALRAAQRDAAEADAALRADLATREDEVGLLLATLGRIDAGEQGPLLLLHPDGAAGSIRAGMILSELAPALETRVAALRADLQRLADHRAQDAAASRLLTEGLLQAQTARETLAAAIAERSDLPGRLTDDVAALTALRASAETLDAFAAGLSERGGATAGAAGAEEFSAAKGTLALPAFGRLLRRPGEADRIGATRPGLALSTRPEALVTAPWSATIRYRGPLLDYGNVIILEPALDYFLVLGGIGTVYGEVGDVLPAGAPVGLMGGAAPAGDDALSTADAATSDKETETLYVELRYQGEAIDPMPWFAETAGAAEPPEE